MATAFYKRIIELCDNNGVSPTKLAESIGKEASTATGWKKGAIPRADTLKLIADYFNTTVAYLKSGALPPVSETVDTSSFRQDVYDHLLKRHKGDTDAAIKAYLAFENAEAEDAAKEQHIALQDNYGIVGHTHAPVTIINGSERKLSELEVALLNIFAQLDVVKQAQLLSVAAELVK